MRRQARLAQEFAAALEGRGVASARRDPALAPLLALAEGLDAVPLAPAADFRDALRRRLLAVASVAPAPLAVPSPAERAKSWVEGWRVQKAIAATAASMAGVVALTGVSVAASRSLPGDALYGVKRSAEGVQVSLARNDVNRGKRHLQHAETRLHEIADLVGTDIALGPAPAGPGQITVAFGGSRSERVTSALKTMDDETREGTRLLFDAYTNGSDDDLLAHVRDFTDRQGTHLREVLDALPTSARDEADASLALVNSLHLRATQLLAVGTGADPVATTAPSPGAVPTAATPSATPSYDALGPLPCTCPGDPTATPAPDPEPTADPEPTPSSAPPTSTSPAPTPEPTTPAPTTSHYELPSAVPEPVASPVESAVDDLNETVPTPVPTLPVPVAPAAPVDAVLPDAPRP
jgi:hypothetical protein